ncbi:DNA circularization protein [Achromobacter xylosoxidans]|nr:DNA circularization N-terminal domain-containing protein [Achromobacter xylosoxidans]
MAWKDEKEKASFRGVPFLVDSERSKRGRRTVLHEYPKRDVPMIEDMGLATQTFSFSAWVAGADCFGQRDALLKALEEEGAGELVHPWYGRQMVVATMVEVSHSESEGGVVRFDLEFTKGESSAFPVGSASTGTRAGLAASSLQTSAQSRFSAAMGAVNGAKAQVGLVQGRLREISQILDDGSLPFRELFRDAQAVYAEITTAPGAFAGRVFGLVDEVIREFRGFGDASRGDGVVSLAGVVGKSSAVSRVRSISPLADPTSASIVGAVVDLVGDAALVDAVRDVAVLPTASPPARSDSVLPVDALRDEPVRVDGGNGRDLADALLGGGRRDLPVVEDVRDARDQLGQAAWALALNADTGHYEELTSARVAAGRHLDAVGTRGLRLKSYTPVAVFPGLVLAYKEYGDATRAGEIVTRNRVMHPGFLPVRELKLIGG